MGGATTEPGLVQRFEAAATRRNTLVAFGAFILATVLIQTVGFRPEVTEMASGPLPETAFLYSTEDVSTVLDSLGSEGRSLYVNALLIDFGFVVTFAFGLGLPLANLLPRLTDNMAVRSFALAPAVAGALDAVENVVLLYAINTFPDMPGAAISVASIFTTVKLVLLFGSLLVLVVAALAVGVRSVMN